MTVTKPLKVYMVVGEDSGDALGADLISKLSELHGNIQFVGLAGNKMQALGVDSLFDISDISVMGISAVAARLPKILSRINATVNDVIKQQPDMLVLIDSPEFSYRVAKRVRRRAPSIKTVKYVAPSVWAWRPGRAAKIKNYIDHILAILPFEPGVLKELGGPDSTYVGHPLAGKIPDISTASKRELSKPPNLLVLPGSRGGEVSRLMPVIGDTLANIKARGNVEPTVLLPAVDRLRSDIEERASTWEIKPTIISGEEAKLEAFRNADVALAASGTVTLELALYKVPTIAIYKLDPMAMRIRHLLTGWTASLPNLIADYPVIPEKLNEYAHPEYIGRMIERLCVNGYERDIQLDGFDLIINRLKQDMPSSELAATKILSIAAS